MSKKRKKPVTHSYESLESRQVLSANPIVSLTGGQIDIQGTEARDIVLVREDAGNIVVHAKSDVEGSRFDAFTFDAADVDKIYFSGKAGNDYFANRTDIVSTAYGNDGNDTLVGGDGDDKLKGGNGDDLIKGHGGDDSLHGDWGNDRIYGYEGNDRLLGWYGDDILVGMDGDDYVSGYKGTDYLFGNAGDDVVKGHEGNDRLRGGDGNDELYGWIGNDRIFGGSGDDYVSGYHGDDILSGDAGDDVIKGHEGNDRLFGGEGDDAIYGWKGDDIANGGTGNDELWGGDGNDLLVGWSGNDILHGDMGNDLLYGSHGDDVVVGYYGNDRLVGGHGADMLCGGYDKDTYVQVGADDVGYDPDGDFESTPGVEKDKVLLQEIWNKFDTIMEEYQEFSDKIATVIEADLQNQDPEINNDTSSTKLYLNDSSGKLSSFDTETGEYEFIGSMNVKMTDIAMSADGALYGLSFNSLFKIDVDTGATALVGSLGRGDMNALTFTEDGRLLAAGFAGNHVYSVDVNTAQMTSIGTFSGRSAGDLTFHDGQLFATSTFGHLVSMNLDDAGKIESSTRVSNVSRYTYGLASQGDNLYATVGTSLYDVDTNGSFTAVTNFSSVGVSQIWGMTEGIS